MFVVTAEMMLETRITFGSVNVATFLYQTACAYLINNYGRH